jgi:hypothetical protein
MGAKTKGLPTIKKKTANEKELRDFLESKRPGELKSNQFGKVSRDPILRSLKISPSTQKRGSILAQLFDEYDDRVAGLKSAGASSSEALNETTGSIDEYRTEEWRILEAEVKRLRALYLQLQYLEDTGKDLL